MGCKQKIRGVGDLWCVGAESAVLFCSLTLFEWKGLCKVGKTVLG